MGQLTGRVAINVKGQRLASKEGATLKFSGFSREGVTGDAGVLGFVEKTEVPEIKCSITHDAKTRLADFEAITDEAISFDCDTGTSYILRNAFCAGAISLSKGEVELTFQGLSVDEVGR
jgi:hypothetical protein